MSIAAINCTDAEEDIRLPPPRLCTSSILEGNSFGRTYDTWYPLTRMCPTYLSSSGGGFEEEEEDDVDDIEPNRDVYSRRERAGRLNARAPLCSRAHVVDEKLYGAELESRGCTCESRIFTFSSGRE